MKNTIYRVLLIEDDLDHAALITRQLKNAENYCITIVHVTTLESAVEAASKQKFDGVLLEIRLPGSDSRETALESKNMFPTIPVLVLTSVRDMSMARLALAAGVDDYLVKTELSGSLICHSLVRAIELNQLKQEACELRSELHDCNEALKGAYA